MRKLLGIILLIVLYAGSVNASCKSEGLDWSWYMNNDKTGAYFNFSNTTGKHFYISKLILYSASKEVVADRGTRIHIKPYGKFNTEGSWGISLRNINTQYIKTGTIYCEVTTAAEATKKKNAGYDFGKKKSWFKWWYILVGLGILGVIGAILDQAEKDNKKGTQSKSSKTKLKTANVSSSNDNLVENVWNGLLPLGQTFWIYYVIVNGIISFGAGFLAEMNDNNIFLIAALVSNIWSGVGTWNSSTNYQLQKIKAQQPYGWAYAAKVLIVLNFLTIGGQAILLFNL